MELSEAETRRFIAEAAPPLWSLMLSGRRTYSESLPMQAVGSATISVQSLQPGQPWHNRKKSRKLQRAS